MKQTLCLGFSFLTLVIVFSSCQKKDGDYWQSNVAPTSASKIIAYVEESSILGAVSKDSLNITYDNMNRMSSAISALTPVNFSFNYNYTNGYFMDLQMGTSFVKDRVLLNANSLVDSSIQYNETNDTITTRWFYNANKKLIEEKINHYSTATGSVLYQRFTYTYDTDGNATEIIEWDNLGFKEKTETITYTAFNGTNHKAFNSMFFAALSNKLMATKTTIYNGSGITINQTYTYNFDSQNRLIKETATTVGYGTIIRKYYY